MKNTNTVSQIEKAAEGLSYDERLRLIERLVNGLRRSPKNGVSPAGKPLAEMAADPEIQRELAQIAQEFASSESDGLE